MSAAVVSPGRALPAADTRGLTVCTGAQLGAQVHIGAQQPSARLFTPPTMLLEGHRKNAGDHNQPWGGIWTCRLRPGPASAAEGWGFPGDRYFQHRPWWVLQPESGARVLVIDTKADADAALAAFPYWSTAPIHRPRSYDYFDAQALLAVERAIAGRPWLDYEAVLAAGLSAVHFTARPLGPGPEPKTWLEAITAWYLRPENRFSASLHESTIWLRWAFEEDAGIAIPGPGDELLGYGPGDPAGERTHPLSGGQGFWFKTAPLEDVAAHEAARAHWRRAAGAIRNIATPTRERDAAYRTQVMLLLTRLVSAHNLVGRSGQPLPVGPALYSAAERHAVALSESHGLGMLAWAMYTQWRYDERRRLRAAQVLGG